MKKLLFQKYAFLIVALLLAIAPAQAADVRTVADQSDSAVSSVTAETLMAASGTRRTLFIQNIGTQSVWISFTGTAAVDTAGSFELLSGASLTFEGDTVVRNAVSIIAETGTGKVTAYEG